jgi:hypothetical protein
VKERSHCDVFFVMIVRALVAWIVTAYEKALFITGMPECEGMPMMMASSSPHPMA